MVLELSHLRYVARMGHDCAWSHWTLYRTNLGNYLGKSYFSKVASSHNIVMGSCPYLVCFWRPQLSIRRPKEASFCECAERDAQSIEAAHALSLRKKVTLYIDEFKN